MKRFLLLVVSAGLLVANIANAQLPGVDKVKRALPKFDLGPKLGANFQQLNGTNIRKEYAGGVVGGLFMGLHKNRMGVQVEGLAKTAKFTVDKPIPIGYNQPITYTVNAVELEIPVLFEYRLFWHLWAQAGGQFSTVLSAKTTSTDVRNTLYNDVAAVIGLEVHLPMRLNIGARYIYGVTNVNNESISTLAGSMKNRTIQACVGFRLI